MSKTHSEKVEKPKAEQHPKEEHKKEEHKTDHKADHHKEEAKGGEQKHDHKPTPTPIRSKIAEPLPGACHSWHCKAKAKQFNFCEEHFDHFKFGLIKKTGEPVPDYEKKIEHYLAHKKNRRAVPKVA